MNELQESVIYARLFYNLVKSERDQRLEPYYYLLEQGTDLSIKIFVEYEMSIEQNLNWREIKKITYLAENILLDWCLTQTLKDLAYLQVKRISPEQITLLFEQAKRHYMHREELIDTVLRLEQ